MNIYVGNLSWNTTEDGLKELFDPHGEVAEAKIIRDRFTGQSRGFGFVEMAQDDQAQAAINELNGKDFDGRALTVNEARPRTERSPGGGRGGDRGGRGGGFKRNSW